MRNGPLLALCSLLGLAGCTNEVLSGANPTEGLQVAGEVGARLAGVVHGGQNPISGAHVYLLAAASGASGVGQAAYGGSGIVATASNASQSLLTSGTLDTSEGATNNDYYVTTDSAGIFSITGGYTCTPGQQVYLYALGGDPGLGSGVNPAAGLMAVLGNCPAAGTFSSGLYVLLNEVSTVAAAYAIAGFATDATHVGSSGTPLAQTGIANAFANAANLETLGTGMALATTPAGNGTVPQAEINTLANILAACVNSTGSGSACTTLFADAKAAGSSGTAATDTATAAINIAHNPSANVAALYGLSSASPPFAGGLISVPNDWTMQITFVALDSFAEPLGLAIDASGNAWIANEIDDSVTELSSVGAILSAQYGDGRGTGLLSSPYGVAIDSSGDAWVTNFSGSQTPGSVAELSPSGTFLSGSGYPTGGLFPELIAIDGANHVWVSDDTGPVELSTSGSILSGSTSGSINEEKGIAVDGSGNVWIALLRANGVAAYANSGSLLSPSGGYTGGFNEPQGVAIDGRGDIWVTNRGNAAGSVAELSNSGTILSGTNGFTGGGLNLPESVAIDGAGNVWVSNDGGKTGITELSSTGSVLSGATGYSYLNVWGGDIAVDGSGDVWLTALNQENVEELIGVAAPAITPIAAGLPATPTADGSSNLGTRP